MEPFFEQHPWGLIVLVIVTVEGWQLFKATVSAIVRRVTRYSHR